MHVRAHNDNGDQAKGSKPPKATNVTAGRHPSNLASPFRPHRTHLGAPAPSCRYMPSKVARSTSVQYLRGMFNGCLFHWLCRLCQHPRGHSLSHCILSIAIHCKSGLEMKLH
jgi:hypothetical protein